MQWLDKLGMPYIAKDVETDKSAYEELLKKNGGSYSGVPVTDIGGDMILGFDRPKLQDAIKKHNIQPVAS
jgi:glutaredoxin